MAKFSGEELDWLNKLEKTNQLRKVDPNLKGVQLADKLEGSAAHASYMLSLSDCLDQAAIDKVRQAAKDNPPFILSFNSARALIRLNGRVDNLPASVHDALDVIFSRRLPTEQIKALVNWMLKGNSPETFNESETGKKKNHVRSSLEKGLVQGVDPTPTSPSDLKKVLELSEKLKAQLARGDSRPAALGELKALLAGTTAETQEDEDSNKKEEKKSKSASGADPFWKWMLGISFYKQLRKKVNKGETLTVTEKVFVAHHQAYEVIKKVLKPLGKIFKKAYKSFWHLMAKIFGKTLSNLMEYAVIILFVFFLLWGIGKIYQLVVVRPLHWLESKVVSALHWGPKTEEPSASISTTPSAGLTTSAVPQPVRDTELKLKTNNSTLTTSNSTTVASYQPSVSFVPTAFDPKLLEIEIASAPSHSVLTDFPLQPDETMPPDLAFNRLQDLTNTDKYTMRIGQGTEKILSVNPTNTTLTISFKSTDAFNGFLNGGGGQVTIFYEDVKAIHTNQIDVQGNTPSTLYQCGLIVSGAKYPFTIQCSSAEDLEHLVSTMEYFIRHSRLGHDTALTGMPYPSQGLRLNNDGVVDKLWAGSPSGKAGVQLGDMVWSVDKNEPLKPKTKALESQLGSLSSGPHDLFVVSQTDREKAQMAVNNRQSGNFNPKRRKVVLGVP